MHRQPDDPGVEPGDEKRRGCGKCFLLALVAGAAAAGAIAIFLAATDARAHDALPTAGNPTGWTYGWECCSAMDCEQVQQSSIGETPKGYLIRRTGEVIAYDDKRIKRSKDEFYHRCTPGGNEDAKRSICLYVPDKSW